MKLKGYIKPFAKNTFSIPIYFEENRYYTHTLNEQFIITAFSEIKLSDNDLIQFHVSQDTYIGNVAIVVFKTSDDIMYGRANEALIHILKYADAFEIPKLKLHSELVALSQVLNIDIEFYENRLNLKSHIHNPNSVAETNIQDVINYVSNYIKEYKFFRKRKSSFKHYIKNSWKEKKLKVFQYFDKNKIENYKTYLIQYALKADYFNANIELLRLIQYQAKAGSPKFIVKSLCDISAMLENFERWEYAKTIILIAQLLETKDVVITTQYAEILKAEGNFKEAKNVYEKILKKSPNDSFPLCGYAEIFKAEGNLKEAKRLYLETIGKFPKDPVPLNGYAEILKTEGDIKGAKNLYIETLRNYPKNIFALNGYAGILKIEGNLAEAKIIYTKALDDFPGNVVALNGYAELLKLEGNFSEAKEMLLQTQIHAPDDMYAKCAYADLLKTEGNIDKAKKIYLELQKTYPHNLIISHSLLTISLLSDDLEFFKKNSRQTLNPVTVDDYYFLHTRLMYDIKCRNLNSAEEIIQKIIKSVNFWQTRDLFKRTLVYLRILRFDFKELLIQINGDLQPESYLPIDHVFKTHILAENLDFENAKNHLRKIKSFPENTPIRNSALLLSELYNLNGLPKSGQPKSTLLAQLNQIEFEDLLTCI